MVNCHYRRRFSLGNFRAHSSSPSRLRYECCLHTTTFFFRFKKDPYSLFLIKGIQVLWRLPIHKLLLSRIRKFIRIVIGDPEPAPASQLFQRLSSGVSRLPRTWICRVVIYIEWRSSTATAFRSVGIWAWVQENFGDGLGKIKIISWSCGVARSPPSWSYWWVCRPSIRFDAFVPHEFHWKTGCGGP